jgi:tetratricopeptide (TPR) repeat protein
VTERLRLEGIVLVPALLVVALFLYWVADDGGYEPATWEPPVLLVLGLLAAVVAGMGFDRLRLSRAGAIALAAFGAYVAWSYLSIVWAAAPGAALTGANRALLYLLLFTLFALLPWRTWSGRVALSAFALAIGALGLVVLVRLGGDGAAAMFNDGRLVYPLDYVNGTAALFTMGAVVSIALASRRGLPMALRALLLGLGTAALEVSVLCASRGWLFALPVIVLLTIAVVPGRVRLILWMLPPLAGTLVALSALLDVFERADAAATEAAARTALLDAAAHAAPIALAVCAAAAAIGMLLAFADRRVTVSEELSRGASTALAALAALAVVAGVVAGLAATDGRPDRTIADYWDRSQTYEAAEPGQSRFAVAGSNRPDFWRVAADATRSQPILGLGQDNWGDYYLRHRRSTEQPRWTHSLQLRLLAHTGIVGLLLFGGFLVAACVAALRGGGGERSPGSEVRTLALLPLIVWAIHGSVDWFWEFPALSGPAFAFLGLAVAAGDEGMALTLPRRGRIAVAVLAGVLGVIAALAVALPYLSDREERAASKGWRADPAAALDRLDRAASLNPLNSGPPLNSGVITLQLGRYAQSRNHLNEAIERDPGNWFLPFVRGLAESEAGDRAAARADYRRARRLDPKGELVGLALTRLRREDPLTAAEAFGQVRRSVRRLTED